MKLAVAFIAALSAATIAFADAGKEVSLSGEGKCLKCALKKADKCQNVLEVKEGEKTVLYKLVGDTSKKFHSELCTEPKKVKVTGKCEKKGEDLEVTVAKIELAK